MGYAYLTGIMRTKNNFWNPDVGTVKNAVKLVSDRERANSSHLKGSLRVTLVWEQIQCERSLVKSLEAQGKEATNQDSFQIVSGCVR